MIDETKLTRNYKENPIQFIGKKLEPVPYEDFYELYVNQKISRDELCNFFGFSKIVFNRLVKEYNLVKKLNKDISKEELYQYYVVENHRNRETCLYFGISSQTLAKYCKKYGIDKSDMRTKNTHETLDKLKENND